MAVLSGLLYINNKDVFTQYGAFLMEEKEGEYQNYSAFLKPPQAKSHTAVSYREEDGEQLPDKLTPNFEPRNITLLFAIMADTRAQFFKNYTAFVRFLITGADGWLSIRLPELEQTYRVVYSGCTDYTQLTDLESGQVVGKFKVTLREPSPNF